MTINLRTANMSVRGPQDAESLARRSRPRARKSVKRASARNQGRTNRVVRKRREARNSVKPKSLRGPTNPGGRTSLAACAANPRAPTSPGHGPPLLAREAAHTRGAAPPRAASRTTRRARYRPSANRRNVSLQINRRPRRHASRRPNISRRRPLPSPRSRRVLPSRSWFGLRLLRPRLTVATIK
jgi:hypothetical protein